MGLVLAQAVPGSEIPAAGHETGQSVLPQLVGAFLLADDVAVVPVDGNAGVRVHRCAQQVLCRPQDGPQNADQCRLDGDLVLVGVLHQILTAAGVLGGGGHGALIELIAVAAQFALEAHHVQRVLHRLMVGSGAQVGVILPPCSGLVDAAFRRRQFVEDLAVDGIRRHGVFLAFLVHPFFAQGAVIEDLLAAEADVLPVVVEGVIHHLRGVQRFGKDAHAQPHAAVKVLDSSRAEQAEPCRCAGDRDALYRARRGLVLGDLREFRRAGDIVRHLKPFVGDGAAAVPDRVGLQVDGRLAAHHALGHKGRFGHNAALHADGQDAAGGVVVQPDAPLRRRQSVAGGIHRQVLHAHHKSAGARPVGLLNKPVCVLPEMQLPQKAAGLLFIAAQQIGRGGCIAGLESGLVVEQQVCPVLADVLRHPQGSQTPRNDAAVRCVLFLVVDVGHVALPPLPPDFDVAVVVRIEVKMLCFVQAIDKSGNIHLAVSLL